MRTSMVLAAMLFLLASVGPSRADTVSAAIIVLDPSDPAALKVHGTGGFNFSVNGAIVVNSTTDGAAAISGSGTISASELDVAGTTAISGNPTVSTPIYDGNYQVLDPLTDLPTPPLGPTQTQPKDASQPLLPGYYPNGINITSPGNYFFQSGIYVIDKGFSVTSANATVRTNGTLFYIRDGAVKITGGTLKVQPTDQAPWDGLSFWQAASNSTSATITSNSGSWVDGTLYFPGSLLQLTGVGTQPFTNQIISWQLDVGGSSALTVDYDGRNPAQQSVPLPSAAGAGMSLLAAVALRRCRS